MTTQTETELAHPVVEQVNDYLDVNGIQKIDFVRGVAYYIDSDKSEDQFRLRHYRLLKGDYGEIRPDEVDAYRSWLHVERNRHRIFNTLREVASYDLERCGRQVWKWASGGYQNMGGVKRLARKISAAGELLREAFGED